MSIHWSGFDLCQDVAIYDPAYYPTAVQVEHWVILEGDGVTYDDLYLAISNFTFVLRGDYTTTPNSLRVTIPDYTVDVDDILDRASNDLVLVRKSTYQDGSTLEHELIRTNLNEVTKNRGSRKNSIGLYGERFVSYASVGPVTWAVTHVKDRTGDMDDPNGRKEFELSSINYVAIKPGDVVQFDGDSVTVDYMTVSASKDSETMTVIEVEE